MTLQWQIQRPRQILQNDIKVQERVSYLELARTRLLILRSLTKLTHSRIGNFLRTRNATHIGLTTRAVRGDGVGLNKAGKLVIESGIRQAVGLGKDAMVYSNNGASQEFSRSRDLHGCDSAVMYEERGDFCYGG